MRYISILCLILSACSAYPDLSVLGEEPRVSAFSEDSQIALESRPTPQVNVYGVSVSWRISPRPGSRLFLYRIEGGERTFLQNLNESEGALWDAPLASNTLYRYEISDESAEVVSTASIRNARDLFVQGEMRLPQDYASISRVFFKENATLVTEGLPIDWKPDFVSGAAGASLVSFVKHRGAQGGYAARSSGEGRIEVRQAAGPLLVEWRGETGPEGARGRDNPRSGRAGTKGRNGGYRSSRYGADRCTDGRRGGNGGPGPRGAKGLPGDRGGDLESLQFKVIYASSDFNLKVLAEVGLPGSGGRGGRGGPGGAGGDGGAAGGMDCSDGPSGSSGAQGPRGPEGEPGQPGEARGEVCVLFTDQDTSCSKPGQSLKFTQ